ncbi:hypothetical protein [Porphyrobacter sp. AAP60]|nr:hypothetical protein [Porphyrobacter sp. AAP60]
MSHQAKAIEKQAWEAPELTVVATSKDIRSGAFFDDEDFTGVPS